MTSITWPQIVTMVFQFASTVAIVCAAVKYYWTRDHKSGETLRDLEETFGRFHAPWTGPKGSLPGITRAVDEAAQVFSSSGLQIAILRGLDPAWGARQPQDEAWMPRLDEFLRFLLIVAAMERNGLLKKRALWDVYHYWFRTVDGNPVIRRYVGVHFPVLDQFIEDSQGPIKEYRDLHEARAAAARRRPLPPPPAAAPDAASAGPAERVVPEPAAEAHE
jgi:hypothetical protein